MKEITQSELRKLVSYRTDGALISLVKRGKIQIGAEIGCEAHKGYRFARIHYKIYLLHRLIWLWHHGTFPAGIDHADGDTTNNRIGNLRIAGQSDNLKNKTVQSNNRCGLKGVSHRNRKNGWRAAIKANGKNIHLGSFSTKEDAAAAYDAAAIRLFGRFARTNKQMGVR